MGTTRGGVGGVSRVESEVWKEPEVGLGTVTLSAT
jgi:hypothetical protein